MKMKKLSYLAIVLAGVLIVALAGPGSNADHPLDDQPTVAAKGGGGGGGKCPKVYAPVTCDNGKTYPNQCVADKRGGKNCVPSGDL